MTDLHFQEKGPARMVQPVTPKGEAWMIDHTSVRVLRLFGAIEVERCLAEDMFNGARADGPVMALTGLVLAVAVIAFIVALH
ncbi:MAG: hypothetical protein WAK69_08505 [Rhodoplanes sp.]